MIADHMSKTIPEILLKVGTTCKLKPFDCDHHDETSCSASNPLGAFL